MFFYECIYESLVRRSVANGKLKRLLVYSLIFNSRLERKSVVKYWCVPTTLKMQIKPYTFIRNAIPIVNWLPKYNIEYGMADLIAGITVGLTLIPQSIAYAALAGLQPQYGLYSAVCGGFIYAVFGTIPEINIAPTSLLALLTMTYSSKVSFGAIPAAILLCFYAGIIEICCGILHLGFLVDFVSVPAVSGLTSAAAILIASAQVRNLLGLPSYNSEKFIDIWKHLFTNLQHLKIWDCVLSLICCSTLLILRKFKDYGTPPSLSKKGSTEYSRLKVFFWFLSIGRNALVIIVSTLAGYLITYDGKHVFAITGQVQAGLPNISFPPFEVVISNKTYIFIEMTKQLQPGLFIIPFMAILANVAVAKSFSQGKVLNATQEMLAVGLCNLAGSFLGSMPVNASFSRASVSNSSGIKTTFAGFYTGAMVILALTFLTQFFEYIPKAALSSIIICAVIFMVEVSTSKKIWKSNKIDALPLLVTFFACLILGIEIGILIGVGVDIILLLFYISRPRIDVQRVTILSKEYLKITPTSSIYYPSAEYVRERVLKNEIIVEGSRSGEVVIIDCLKLTKTDFTAAKCLDSLAKDLRQDRKIIAFLRLEPDLSKILSQTCPNCIFAFTDDALSDILRERRNSDILDSYKNISVEPKIPLPIFDTTISSKL